MMGSTCAFEQELLCAHQRKYWISSLITCRHSGPDPGLHEVHLELWRDLWLGCNGFSVVWRMPAVSADNVLAE